jgi:cytochrome c5
MRSTVMSLIFLAAATTAGSAQDLPPGPGSDIVARTCTVCHEMDIVTAQRHDADGWRVVANAMIKNGAELTPQEVDQVVEYLAKTLPQ